MIFCSIVMRLWCLKILLHFLQCDTHARVIGKASRRWSVEVTVCLCLSSIRSNMSCLLAWGSTCPQHRQWLPSLYSSPPWCRWWSCYWWRICVLLSLGVRSKGFGRLSLGLQLRSLHHLHQAHHATFNTLEVAITCVCVCVCVHVCIVIYLIDKVDVAWCNALRL